MRSGRRTFLKYLLAGTGLVSASATAWVATSQQRGARWLRQIIADGRRAIAPAPVRPNPGRWSDNDLTLCWLGHATVLINFHGFRILTDPAFGPRIGVSLGVGTAGPKRYIASALAFRELPPIDLLLLSHAHMDHLDLPSLRCFAPETAAVSAKVTQDLLAEVRLRRVTELAWGERTTVRCGNGDLEVEAFEVKHWGRRWPNEMDRGYNGYILRREGRAILFGGDTALTPLFGELRSRGPFEAAIMPIAAYQPWIRNHCTPEQAVEMANQARAHYLVPVHHQTFRLSDEPMNEPIERLEAALEREPERLALRRVGESFVCPQA